jgi:arylsulfatase A
MMTISLSSSAHSVSSAVHPSAAEATQSPTFIVIFADDLGYGDLACYGAKDIATPHIDRMAREGSEVHQRATSRRCARRLAPR